MSKKKVLLVDDETDLLDLLSYNLLKAGFAVRTAENGPDALAAIEHEVPDLVVLDVMMPGMNGLEVCRRIRAGERGAHLPVLMLTARSEEDVEVLGLEAGADDYVPKPVSTRLLLSRIRALLRRAGSAVETPAPVLEVENLKIDRERYLVVRTDGRGVGERVHLPRKEFELLFLLASRPGRVFTREEILDRVWGTDVYVMNRTVDVHIRKIRERLGGDYIETVTGVGYRFRDQDPA